MRLMTARNLSGALSKVISTFCIKHERKSVPEFSLLDEGGMTGIKAELNMAPVKSLFIASAPSIPMHLPRLDQSVTECW